MSKLTVSTDVANEIKMTRTFAAPKRLVHRAMTEPELLKRWLGGDCSKVLSVEIDPRVGGTFKYVYGQPDGSSFSFSGTYQEINDSRSVHTEMFNGQPPPAIVTTTLVEQEGKTTMTMVMSFDSQEIRDMVLGTGMADGAGQSYDHLDRVLATL
ncbi:MAG: SRPBCC family protein [Polyangiaceae bacterium]|nr:SRPBCC family protein [Polyangiaceae bacterium]